MGKYNYSRKISLIRFMKAHVHHPWQNYSSYRVNQAQASLSAKPSWTSPDHTQNPAIESLRKVTSQNLNTNS